VDVIPLLIAVDESPDRRVSVFAMISDDEVAARRVVVREQAKSAYTHPVETLATDHERCDGDDFGIHANDDDP
jgi:hypothetical protein